MVDTAMTDHELLQLGVCLLFPLGLLAAFMWNIGVHQGWSGRKIAAHVLVVVACIVGVVAIGWWLSVSREAPLLSYEAGNFGFGAIRALDIVGLLVCAVLLGVVLWTLRRLSNPAESDREPKA